jgi:SAM-dependent methyltransferase
MTGGALPCPLCAAAEALQVHEEHGRRFHLCPECGLVFVDPADHPTPAAEAARYAHHHNDPADPGYREHLARLVDPLCARAAGPRALDYGSGPSPALAALLRERGLEVTAWDPLYAPDRDALVGCYDVIACCEVAEHFRAPAREFVRLAGLLAPDGWLGLSTKLLAGPDALPGWWYARDATHLVFYQQRTMEWLAARFCWDLEVPAPDVTLFHAAPLLSSPRCSGTSCSR